MPHSSIASRQPRKKALLIGVSGLPMPPAPFEEDADSGLDSPPIEERTCLSAEDSPLTTHRDIELVRGVLTRHYGYSFEDIIVMEDYVDRNSPLFPDKKHIIRQMRKLVKGARPEDHLFFFFAGHGLQSTCNSDSESDGEDEFIQAADGKCIRDNTMKHILVDQLPPSSQLVALIDACHSGSMLDLPHKMLPLCRQRDIAVFIVSRTHRTVTAVRMRIKMRKARSHAEPSLDPSDPSPNTGTFPTDPFHVIHHKKKKQQAKKPQRPPLVISLSSSLDSQESIENEEGGPLARAFAKTHDANPNITFRTLLSSLEEQFRAEHQNRRLCMQTLQQVKDELTADGCNPDSADMRELDALYERARGFDYAQLPQLRGSQPFEIDAPFVI